ncbi:sigma-54-dependent transcriptional regulator [Sphingorhabdus sp.]|jgi:two-component system nitrogen regulation response regulator NtrX|uniref:nitrogen assimilation response regulator NtrX n=1 Tax=Sphingorhabdus sp. TaxID=1902408 RepID=UPI0037CB3F95
MALDILIVDDEQDIRDLVSGVLDDEGYGTRTAASADEALAALDERLPSLILLDVWLRGSSMDGIELLRAIKLRDPQIPVIVFSGHGNIDTAVAAIGHGAADFIEKPFEASKLLHLVSKATETERLRAENAALKARVGHSEELTGSSAAINAVRATLKKVAGTGSRMLITGPAGVGKEVAARLLHSWSPRSDSAFVSVSAARLSPERFDEELFGIEKDGRLVQAGMLEKAHGGTLFLDEVADMPWTTQGKILRVLTDQSFVRVGGDRQIRVDVRFVSATACDLAIEIAEGRFREDLFYRLNVVPVEIPPLSGRREDIPDLANHYAARFASEHRIPPPYFSDDAMAALQACEWPGNVRQLRNIIERTIILAPANRIHMIDADMLPSEVINSYEGTEHNVTSLMGAPLREAREAFEREYLRVQIKRFSGNISKTAAFVGMERSALHRKLKLLGISVRKNGLEEGEDSDA